MLWDNTVGAGLLMAYYLVACLFIPTFLKVRSNIPTEVVRKMQHIAYSLSIFLLLTLFTTWYFAVAGAFLLVLIGYPALYFLEGSRAYRKLFVDRTSRGGELRRQLLYVQLSFAALILLFWGLLGSDWRYLAAVPVMGWGFGDAAAALVGKSFGRTFFAHRHIDGSKTFEGTSAMIVTAAAALFLTLHLYADKPWHVSLIVSLLVAPVCGIVELFSRRGLDTLTVPLTAAACVIPLLHLFALLGW